MKRRIPIRVFANLSAADQARLNTAREQVAQELDDLNLRNRMRHEAQSEATLSGELRRAVHQSEHSLTMIAQEIDVPPRFDAWAIGLGEE